MRGDGVLSEIAPVVALMAPSGLRALILRRTAVRAVAGGGDLPMQVNLQVEARMRMSRECRCPDDPIVR
jgi:hypothetical protein